MSKIEVKPTYGFFTNECAECGTTLTEKEIKRSEEEPPNKLSYMCADCVMLKLGLV